MRTDYLQYILEVAKCHSISIAAEKLHVTQPALSMALKNLEQDLGVRLFNRSKNGVFLTTQGEAAIIYMQRIVEAERQMRTAIDSRNKAGQSALQGYLHVAVIPSLSFALFQELLPVFSKRYPQIKLRLTEKNPEQVVAMVAEEVCDLGFFINDEVTVNGYIATGQLHVQRLYEEKIFVIVRNDSPLAQKASLVAEDIKNQPLSTTNFYGHGDEQSNLFDPAVEMNVVLISDNFNIVQRHVLEGDSIAVMANSCLDKIVLKDQLVAVPFHLPTKSGVYTCYPVATQKQPLIQAFLTVVGEFA